jgi:hypothetical protein
VHAPSAVATLLLTSFDAAAMTRVCCHFETYQSIVKSDHGLDIILGGNSADGKSSTSIICTTSSKETRRGKEQQSHAANVGKALEAIFNARFHDARASEDGDKRRIVEKIFEQYPVFSNFELLRKKRIAAPLLFHRACEGDVTGVQELVQLSADLSYNTTNGTALHGAASRGHAEIVTLLLNAACDMNNQGTSGLETPLHKAASFNRLEVISNLLTARCDPHLKNKKGETALDVATKEKKSGVVELLSTTSPTSLT